MRRSATPWQALAAAWRGQGSARVQQLLRSAVAAARGERGYIITSQAPPRGDGSIVVQCAVELGAVGSAHPSRAIVDRAIRVDQPEVQLNLAADPRWSSQTSIRTLGLQVAMMAPIRIAGPERAALVLDGRRRPEIDRAELAALLDAFSAMIAASWPTPTDASAQTSQTSRHPESNAGGESTTFQRTLDRLRRAARIRLPVLILGETGTGKEALAQLVHAESPRASAPFVALNCSALPDTLVEAELFGTLRGAYTGAERDRAGLFRAAHRGTLFLDEIGDMPLAAQARLLRAIQEQKVRPVGATDEIDVDVRIVAATHRDLRALCAQGLFRSDLYHRLAVIEIKVPPLRERMEDLSHLVAELGARLATETGLGPPLLSAGAWQAMHAHAWPGNIRELHAVLARGMLAAGDRPLAGSDLQIEIVGRPASRDLEGQMIEVALRESLGNLSKAATRIGWTRQKLYRRMQALGIRRAPASGE